MKSGPKSGVECNFYSHWKISYAFTTRRITIYIKKWTTHNRKTHHSHTQRSTTISGTIPYMAMFSVWHTMSLITFQNQQFCPFEDQKESDSIHRVFEVVVLLVEVGRFAVVRKDPLLASHENFMKVWVKTMVVKSANSPKKWYNFEINWTKLAQTFPKIWLKVSSRWCQNFWSASILTFSIIYIILFDHCGIHTLSKVTICHSKFGEVPEHNAAVT